MVRATMEISMLRVGHDFANLKTLSYKHKNLLAENWLTQ